MTGEGTPHKRRYAAAHSYQSAASAWRDDSRARAFAAMTEVEWAIYLSRWGLAGVPAPFRRSPAVEDAMGLMLAEDENEVWAGRAPEPLVLPGCRVSENISALRAESVQIGVLPHGRERRSA